MRLQDREWKEFQIQQLFNVSIGKNHSEVLETKCEHGLPYIIATRINNGFIGYVKDYNENEIKHAYTMTIGSRGNDAITHLQMQDYIPSNNVSVIEPKYKISKKALLFIATIIKQERYKYSYGRLMGKEFVKQTVIKLPAKLGENKDYIPDWQFMDDYIKSLEPKADISELLEIVGDDNPQELAWFIEQDIDIAEFKEYLKPDAEQNSNIPPLKLTDRKWRIFKVRDFFSVTRGSRIVKNKDFTEEITDKNIYPVITAKTTNNGIDGYYQEQNCEGKCIVVCGEASGMYPTYQENPCWLLDTVREIKPKIDTFNLHIALFIMTLLRQEMYKYDFTRKAKPSDILETALYLPVTRNKAPDWQFMEDYIRSLNLRNSVIRS